MALDLEGFNGLADVGEPDGDIIERLRFDDALDIPFQMTDVDMWRNYCDDDLYQLDVKVREFFSKTRFQRRSKGGQKTAVPLVFMWMTGRKPGPQDSQVCVTLHRLLKYYCTSYTGTSKIAGVRFTRVYHFSPYAATRKRPYSMRLRLEENNDESSYRPYGDLKDKRKVTRFRDRGDGDGADVGDSQAGRG